MKSMLVWLLFNFALFYALTPGVLLSLPAGGSTMTKAATHAAVFAAVHVVLGKLVKKSLL